MAKRVELCIVGVDVSKASLEIWCEDTATGLDNEAQAIRGWLRGLSGPCALALEATGSYHMALVELACRAGHAVYVLDGYRLNRYRDSLGLRAKTDRGDAYLLARYLSREIDQLRPVSLASPAQQRLWRLLKRRATMVRARTQLRLSLEDLTELRPSVQALLKRITRLIGLIDKRMRQALTQLAWQPAVNCCQSVPGIGPLTATALTAVWHRGHFSNSDALVAFLGLDVRVRQSGTYQGRRKLTKRGDSECRRLLYNAAAAAARNAAFKPYYQRLRDRGLSYTQAIVALARKLVRIAFALLRDGTTFQTQRYLEAA